MFLKEYNRNDRNRIPINPGIYFLFENEVLVYIGKAKNLRHRINQHHNQNFYQQEMPINLELILLFIKLPGLLFMKFHIILP